MFKMEKKFCIVSISSLYLMKKSQHGCVRWAPHTITCNQVKISAAEGKFNYFIIYTAALMEVVHT